MQTEQLLNRIYDAAVDPKGWVSFVQSLEASLEGTAVMLSLPHPSPQEPGGLTAPSLDPRYVESYVQSYFACDPWTPPLERLPAGGFLLGAECVRAADALQRGFLHQWLEPQDLVPSGFAAGIIERDEHAGTARLAFFPRLTGRTPPAPAALRHAWEVLLPHLRRAVQIHFRKAQLEAERRALSASFDRMPLALILVDARGRVRAANRAADRLLAERDGLVLDRDGLKATNPEESEQLSAVLAEAARPREAAEAALARALLLTRRSGRRPLQALIARIRLREGEEPGAEPAVAALFVGDPDRRMETSRELLRLLYNLTPSEADLACELGSGRTLAIAASRLSVTPGTARQRLSQIFAKTGARRQSDLVRLLLTGPAQLCQEK